MSAHAGTSRRFAAPPGGVHGRRGALAVVATAVGAVGFGALLLLVSIRWSPLAHLDISTADDLTAWIGPQRVLVGVFLLVQQLSQPWVLRAAAVIVAALLIRSGRRRLGGWLVCATALGTVLELVLKLAIGRARPVVAEPIEHVRGLSFPSGHALTSALVVGALLVVVAQLGASRRIRVVAWTVGLVIVGLVGFDRLVLGAHYVSDVLAGWFVAACVLGGTALLVGVGRRPSRPRRRGSRSRRNVAVVVNPAKVEAGFRDLVEREAARAGWNSPLWLETTPDDPGHAMVRTALGAQVDLVIAAGGDGTVRVVCAGLAGTGVPVGIVPAGTGNLLVRNLSLPLDQNAAIRTAFAGQNRVLDMVKVDGDGLGPDRFAVMAGLGLDAAVVGEALPQLKARMGWAAYAVSMARNLSFPAVRVDITVDDAPTLRRWVRTVLVGNVGTLHAGLSLLPFARPDDGMLDVVAVAPRRLTDWPGLAWRVVRRSHTQDDRLRTWRGRRVVIRAVDACPRQLDGDVIEVGHELRCEIEPGVLLVRIPRRPVSRDRAYDARPSS